MTLTDNLKEILLLAEDTKIPKLAVALTVAIEALEKMEYEYVAISVPGHPAIVRKYYARDALKSIEEMLRCP